MNDLTSAKLQKLQEQRELSDRLNNVLTKEGGLIQSPPRARRPPASPPPRPPTPVSPRSATQTCKNLEVAVAVSKRPGFFESPAAGVPRVRDARRPTRAPPPGTTSRPRR